MSSLLDQLYETKLQLIAIVTMVGGVLLLVASRWVSRVAGPDWLGLIPLAELGSTLVTFGLLGILLDYLDRKHGDERAEQQVRQAVRREAPAIRDAVLDSFAFNPASLKNIASPDTLERIATNALGLRLGDPALAADVFTDVRDQVIRAAERWHDAAISVVLSPWTGGPSSGPESMFVATVRTTYRVRRPNPTARFACVADAEEYRELLLDPTMTAVWLFGRPPSVEASSREAFEVVQFTVDGKTRPIRHTERPGSQLYSISFGARAQKADEVTISTVYRVLVQRHGHLLYLDIPRPTKGLQVELHYGDCGIRRVSTLDFIASAQQPRILRSPSSVPTQTVTIGFDGWVFPKSGVAFVWVLEREMALEPKKVTTS